MSDMLNDLAWLPKPYSLVLDECSKRFLKRAYIYSRKSPDPSTKNGALLVSKSNEILTCECNKFPIGVTTTAARLFDKQTKYRMIVHAENGAIFKSARQGKQTRGSTLYCPFCSCSECAKAIIQGGVERIVCHAQLMALASSHTTWVNTIVSAWEMLHEVGIICDLYDGKIGVTTRFNGENIEV